MSQMNFDTVRRGYDPDQVDQAVAALQSTVSRLENQLVVTQQAGQAAANQAQDQQHLVDQLQADLAATRAELKDLSSLEHADFSHLGDRVGQILTLAKEEADDLVAKARTQADEQTEQARALADQTRQDAEREAEEVRSKAEADATRTVEEANAHADDVRAQVKSEAAAARDEAAALMDSQRAAATAAAIDFEKTLGERRQEALKSLEADIAARHQEINEATVKLNEIRGEAQKTEFAARERAESIVRAAEQRGDEILIESQTRADQVRDNAERELAAALARRDSINEQLSGVREMLAAYGSPGASDIIDVTDASEVTDEAHQDEPGDDAEHEEQHEQPDEQQQESEEEASEGASGESGDDSEIPEHDPEHQQD